MLWPLISKACVNPDVVKWPRTCGVFSATKLHASDLRHPCDALRVRFLVIHTVKG